MPRNTAKVGKEREEEECVLVNINMKRAGFKLGKKEKTGLEKFYEDENGFSVLVAENAQNVF